jgi:hypothetical protein
LVISLASLLWRPAGACCCCRYPQSTALFRLLCMTRHSCRNINQSDMTSSTVTAKQI